MYVNKLYKRFGKQFMLTFNGTFDRSAIVAFPGGASASKKLRFGLGRLCK